MSNESFVKGDFKKLEKILQSLKSGYYVDIGILENSSYPDGENVAYIGGVHEFGTDIAGRGNKTVIPKRSFIRMPLEKKSAEITKLVEKNLQKNLAKGDIEQIFKEVGIACEIQIQQAFETSGFGTWESNKDSTVAKKGSSKPLIDTGVLRKSITWKVGKK